MKVLVCGGRNYLDFENVYNVLKSISNITVVIHGAANGADMLADKAAKLLGIKTEPYPADWNLYKKAAGSIRNQRMLDEGMPDLVLVFPGGNGTKDMLTRSIANGFKVQAIKDV